MGRKYTRWARTESLGPSVIGPRSLRQPETPICPRLWSMPQHSDELPRIFSDRSCPCIVAMPSGPPNSHRTITSRRLKVRASSVYTLLREVTKRGSLRLSRRTHSQLAPTPAPGIHYLACQGVLLFGCAAECHTPNILTITKSYPTTSLSFPRLEHRQLPPPMLGPVRTVPSISRSAS